MSPMWSHSIECVVVAGGRWWKRVPKAALSSPDVALSLWLGHGTFSNWSSGCPKRLL